MRVQLPCLLNDLFNVRDVPVFDVRLRITDPLQLHEQGVPDDLPIRVTSLVRGEAPGREGHAVETGIGAFVGPHMRAFLDPCRPHLEVSGGGTAPEWLLPLPSKRKVSRQGHPLHGGPLHHHDAPREHSSNLHRHMSRLVVLEELAGVFTAPDYKPREDVLWSALCWLLLQWRRRFLEESLCSLPNAPLHSLIELPEASDLRAGPSQQQQQPVLWIETQHLDLLVRRCCEDAAQRAVRPGVLCQVQNIELQVLRQATQDGTLAECQEPTEELPRHPTHEQLASLPGVEDVAEYCVVDGRAPLLLGHAARGHVGRVHPSSTLECPPSRIAVNDCRPGI
mmetsp:Transcript_22116/g.52013  ORF Transcript_22116/g.52013 Transcript_22116/m.52013 type:complete len:337 (-) Transcript_22116:1225-2235(-)